MEASHLCTVVWIVNRRYGSVNVLQSLASAVCASVLGEPMRYGVLGEVTRVHSPYSTSVDRVYF